MSTQLRIQDETSETVNTETPKTLADAMALISKLTTQVEELSKPVIRTRKFKVSSDGRLTVYGTGIKMTREQAEWLLDQSNALKAFLAANPDVM